MADLIQLTTYKDNRGALTVIEKILPFDVKRIFYIYGVDDSVRGKHRHHKTIQAAICVKGSCMISNNDGKKEEDFLLDSPEKCLLIYQNDYHWMHKFTPDAVLLVMASEYFNPEDYIYEPYNN